MPAGLQVFNDFNTVQIDQDYMTRALTAKGSITMTQDPNNRPQPMRIGSFSVTGQNPIVAFAAPGKDVCQLYGNTNGSTWTFHYRCKSNENFTLYYWVFDNPALGLGVNQNLGFQVYRGDGSLAFDAGMKPMRIVHVGDLDMPAENEGVGSRGLIGYSQTITLPAGRVYAAVQGTFAYVALQYDGGGIVRPPDPGEPSSGPKSQTGKGYHSAANVNGNTITYGLREFESFVNNNQPANAPEFCYPNGDLMHYIVDVTNY